MIFSTRNNILRWLVIIAAFFALVLILWNTYIFFTRFKNEERIKMELWAAATQTLNNAGLDDTDLELPLQIINTNHTIPIIQTTDRDSIINMINVDEKIWSNPKKSQKLLNKFKSENKPIVIEFAQTKQYLYYGNSSLLTKLKYYPGFLILIVFFFGALIISFYRTSRISAMNRLWAGMAKETAHQIGTPLSSLLGWVEIMKMDNVNEQTISEVKKDVERLQTIADRFSKIGSKPILTNLDLVKETEKSFDYLKARVSKQITLSFTAPDKELIIPINSSLHNWTIENLIKNAIDATKGKGIIDVNIEETNKWINIKIKDTGKGIHKKHFNKIFEPGYTTKKRGWGLGLSLTKRIVEEYHNGIIKVSKSELGKGTTICISYRKL